MSCREAGCARAGLPRTARAGDGFETPEEGDEQAGDPAPMVQMEIVGVGAIARLDQFDEPTVVVDRAGRWRSEAEGGEAGPVHEVGGAFGHSVEVVEACYRSAAEEEP